MASQDALEELFRPLAEVDRPLKWAGGDGGEVSPRLDQGNHTSTSATFQSMLLLAATFGFAVESIAVLCWVCLGLFGSVDG